MLYKYLFPRDILISLILFYPRQKVKFPVYRLTGRDSQINRYPAKALEMLLILQSTLVSLINSKLNTHFKIIFWLTKIKISWLIEQFECDSINYVITLAGTQF